MKSYSSIGRGLLAGAAMSLTACNMDVINPGVIDAAHFDPEHARRDPSQLVNLVQMGDGAAAIVVAPDDGTPGPAGAVVKPAYQPGSRWDGR